MAEDLLTPDFLDELVERFDPEGFDAPNGRALVRVRWNGDARDVSIRGRSVRVQPPQDGRADTLIEADERVWKQLAQSAGAGLAAFGSGKLKMRGNLHVGVGFLSATSGAPAERRLRFGRAAGLAFMEAGDGEPVVMIHGLGGTKASFLPTVVALGQAGYQAIAIDQAGFGDSHKPVFAPYDAAYLADQVVKFLDERGIDTADFIGNSLGGRVTLELGLVHADRTRRLALLCCALPWKHRPAWARYLPLVRPELGLIQPAPRAIVEEIVRRAIPMSRQGWTAAGVDEFLRSYLTPRGRAAFYAAARNIFLEKYEPFWERLSALEREALFVWGRHDPLIPAAFAGPVRKALPDSRHATLDCGHVPQIELPGETESLLKRFLSA
ncbi:MAG TPA: alpha/beta fold hydrolase [Thermoleophilaceae bacterium]|nr:alpha/beta fold hydrolase [Thermoleophilaceae bacterium]